MANIDLIVAGALNMRKKQVYQVLQLLKDEGFLERITPGVAEVKIVLQGCSIRGPSIVVRRDEDSVIEFDDQRGGAYPVSDKEEDSNTVGLILRQQSDNPHRYKVVYCSFGGLYEQDPEDPFWAKYAFSRKFTSFRKNKKGGKKIVNNS